MLGKITLKNLLLNKKRTIVTIIGVSLSSALLFAVGIFVSSMQTSNLEIIKRENGLQHIIVSSVESKDFAIFSDYDHYKLQQLELTNGVLNKTDIDFAKYMEVTGEFPKNNNEIIISNVYGKENNLTINSTIKLDNREYKVVGIYDKVIAPIYYDYDYKYRFNNIYTYDKNLESADIYVNFKKDHLKSIEQIGESLGRQKEYKRSSHMFEYDGIKTNYSLLSAQGIILDSTLNNLYTLILIISLSILGFICVFVIYNSFAISVNERKKQFGILASLGTPKIRTFMSVILEGFMIGVIAIPVGFLIAYGIILLMTNFMSDALVIFGLTVGIKLNPIFMLVSLIFIIVMIFISCASPAIRATEVTPIEAIRGKNDIINKRILGGKIIKKIFGIEGELAIKNIKRNKKKYRVTLISIIISIILFVTGGAITSNILATLKRNMEPEKGDLNINISLSDYDLELVNKIKKIPYIEEITISKSESLTFEKGPNFKYNDTYLEFMKSNNYPISTHIIVKGVDEDTYNKYLEKTNLKDKIPIYLNSAEYLKKGVTVFDNFDATFCNNDKCNIDFGPIYLYNNEQQDQLSKMIIEIETFDNFFDNDSLEILIKATDGIKFDNEYQKLVKDYSSDNINYYNGHKNYQEAINTVNAFRYTVFAFIAFVIFISLTSVINTISTNMELRKRDFAVLKSIGMSNGKIIKMISLESIFLGIKAILYGIPLAFLLNQALVYLLQLDYTNSDRNKIFFPSEYIFISMISTICIIFITMIYFSYKYKKNNIIETIREENI